MVMQAGQGLAVDIDYLQRIQSSARRMSNLIKDLLAYSRISTQQESARSVELDDVIRTVLIDLEYAIQKAEASILTDPLPVIMGNASQLGQLFQNLIGNALKFHRRNVISQPAGPQIKISAQVVNAADLPVVVSPARPAMAYYRIDVSDNGIGFDEKYANQIFQVFQRLHNRDEFDGTGVGLAICQRVATNHGGAITASGKLNEGATFHVYLPVLSHSS